MFFFICENPTWLPCLPVYYGGQSFDGLLCVVDVREGQGWSFMLCSLWRNRWWQKYQYLPSMWYNIAEPDGSSLIDQVNAELVVRRKKRPLRAVMKHLVKIMTTCHEMSFRICLSHALRKILISAESMIAIVSRCDSVRMKISGSRFWERSNIGCCNMEVNGKYRSDTSQKRVTTKLPQQS